MAAKEGFDELPGPEALKRLWQRAYARWRKLRLAGEPAEA